MDTGSLWNLFDHHHDHHHHDARRELLRRMGGRGHRGGHGRGFPFGGNPFGGNPFGGGPFGGGPFFRRGGRARRGDVRAAILALLAEEPRNGYQLMVEIERRSEGAWRPSPGSMYPALQQLEDEGLVRSESGGASGRTFHLTDKGRAEAEASAKETTPWEEAAGEDGDAFRELAVLVRQVTVAAMQVGQAGTHAQVAEARKVLTETRRALYRLLADGGLDDEEQR